MTDSSPAPQDHVLLIGISTYDGCRSLQGCVNDIDAIQEILIERLHIDGSRIRRLVSPVRERRDGISEQLATLENIREALTHLASDEVKPGDRVFIYWSSHGSRVRVEHPDGTIHFSEALLPKDHVVSLSARQYLFDWELSERLEAIAERTTSLTLVLDACCSAGATRDALQSDSSRARFVPSPNEPYIVDASAPKPTNGGVRSRSLTGNIATTVRACQVVAACFGDETARESEDGNELCLGDFTRALLRELGSLPDGSLPDVRWGRIWYELLAQVHLANPRQHPWISGSFARRVFGSPPEHGDTGYAITRDGDEYRIHAGSLFGVTRGAEVAVYGSEPPTLPPVGLDRHLRCGSVRVFAAAPSTARASAIGDPFPLPPGARARLVKAGEAARLQVSVEPSNPAIEEALRESSLLELVDEAAELELIERGGGWMLCDKDYGPDEASGAPWLFRSPRADGKSLRLLAEHYYHFSRPMRTARLCQDLQNALTISIHDASNTNIRGARAQDLRNFPELPTNAHEAYEVFVGEPGTAKVPLCIGVRNDAPTPLSVTLVFCNNSGTVYVGSSVVIGGGNDHVFWFKDVVGRPFMASRIEGHPTTVDRIIAIGTTNRNASLHELGVRTKFSKVLRSDNEREERNRRGSTTPPELWTAAIASLWLVPPPS